MRTWRVLTILFVEVAFSYTGFGASTKSPARPASLLPWQTIAEKFVEGGWFCTKADQAGTKGQLVRDDACSEFNRNCNYAYQPKEALTLELPSQSPRSHFLGESDVSLAKWVDSSWREMRQGHASVKHRKIVATEGAAEEGFFRLRFAFKAKDEAEELSNFESYAVVSSNWKRDILSFCRELKEEIETDRDPQLIRSSISVSHCDHAMEVINKASFLSDEVLKTLGGAVQSKHDFDAGGYPDLVIGLNKLQFKRFEGASIEEFVVFVPDSYRSSEAWPLFVHTDNARWAASKNYSPRSGLIDLWWHTVTNKNVRWKNFTALMAIMKQKLNIDEDRMYVSGECSNGLAAMSLALNYPDRWAECSVSLTSTYRHMAGNALNLSLIFVKGTHDEPYFLAYYDFAVKCFQYNACRHFEHSRTQTIVEARGRPVPETVREKNPAAVSYTIESLHNAHAYWVKIDGREDENLPGKVEASADGQKIIVKTENVDAYSLDLIRAPLDSNRPVEIIENGRSVGIVTNDVFTRKRGKYINANIVKDERLHGPVWDAFTDPYVVVYGTGATDTTFAKVGKNIASELARGGPYLSDMDMPRRMISEHNLILIGQVRSDSWLARIPAELPVHIKQRRILTTNGKSFDGDDLGYIVIYPNPLNPEKYVVVCSATSGKGIANMLNAYSQMKSIRPVDVGIFEVTDTGSIKWHVIERFNTVWDWHEGWDRVLSATKRKHAEWQWHRWAAKAVRTQLKVDVAICENPFLFEESLSIGQLTYRDLFNNFRNSWIIKVNMKGKLLRALLMVPFGDISKREVDAPIIDGVSFVKSPLAAGEEVLAIDEIVDDDIYVVALPEKCINGQRLGLVLQDYSIVDQKFLVPILKEYLETNRNVDIDADLDSLKFAVF